MKQSNEIDFEEDGSTIHAAENCIYINGTIEPSTVAPAIGFIIGANAANAYEDIFLFINSSGGHLGEGFALADIIKTSKIPVTTVAIGECDSSALIIAMSGAKRFVAPSTSILSHQYSAGIGLSKHADIQARLKDFTMTAKKVVDHYVKCTGLDESTVKETLVCDTDVFLSPEEAVGFGLFDAVLHDMAQIFADHEEESE